MGTPAQANGEICFANETVAKHHFQTIKDWVNKANEHLFEKDSEFDGDYEITDVELHEPVITFNAYSGRDINLDWQLEMFCKFCQSIQDCISFDSSVTIMGDGRNWVRED